MSSRLLLNFLLLVIVFLMAYVAIRQPWQEIDKIPASLSHLLPDDINKITIVSKTGSDIALIKQHNIWRIQSPLSNYAEVFRINGILKLLNTASYASYDLSQVNLKDLALEDASLQVIFNQTRIKFGTTETLNGHRYVQINNKVHLINDNFYYQLDTPAVSFVSRNLFPQSVKITRLHLKDYSLHLISGQWTYKPASLNLASDDIQKRVSLWKNAQALSVSLYSPLDSDFPVEIDVQDQTVRFLVEQNDSYVILKRPDTGVQYYLPVHISEELFNPVSIQK